VGRFCLSRFVASALATDANWPSWEQGNARQRSSETEDTHKAQLNANVLKCSEHLI